MITPRDLSIIQALALYYVLSREQIQRLCFATDDNGRTTRRRLQTLVADEYIHRHTLFPFQAQLGSPAPVYYPAKKGCELPADHFKDERHLLTCTNPPQPNNLLHWLAISDFHITLNAAIATQNAVAIGDFLNEWDIANKDESKPEARFRLYTLLSAAPRLVCAPDAGFEVCVGRFRKAFYLELDCGTVSVAHIAAQRPKGYAEFADKKLYRRHFPAVNVDPCSILLVTPLPRRRDHLCKELAKQPGAQLWKVIAQADCVPESILFAPVFYPCGDGEPTPLIKKEMIVTPSTEGPS